MISNNLFCRISGICWILTSEWLKMLCENIKKSTSNSIFFFTTQEMEVFSRKFLQAKIFGIWPTGYSAGYQDRPDIRCDSNKTFKHSTICVVLPKIFSAVEPCFPVTWTCYKNPLSTFATLYCQMYVCM